jgi:hypothetical protein
MYRCDFCGEGEAVHVYASVIGDEHTYMLCEDCHKYILSPHPVCELCEDRSKAAEAYTSRDVATDEVMDTWRLCEDCLEYLRESYCADPVRTRYAERLIDD